MFLLQLYYSVIYTVLVALLLFQCFFFFVLREKLSSGSLAGVKTGLSKIYIECIIQSNFAYVN